MNTEMTDEQMRLKIAEAVGWIAVKYDWEIVRKRLTEPHDSLVGISPAVQTLEHGKDETKAFNYWQVPNYSTSLDKMHEAEKTLAENQRERFWFHLAEISGAEQDPYEPMLAREGFKVAHATAKMLAVAFLRAVGKGEA